MKEEMQLCTKDKNGNIRKELTYDVYLITIFIVWFIPIYCLVKMFYNLCRKDMIWIKKSDYYKLKLKQMSHKT